MCTGRFPQDDGNAYGADEWGEDGGQHDDVAAGLSGGAHTEQDAIIPQGWFKEC